MAVTAPNRRSKYDWEKWTDGKEHKATWGVDFNCGVQSFVVGLHQRARSQEGLLFVETSTEGLTVTFRFHFVEEAKDEQGKLF